MSALGFSKDATYLGAADLHNDHNVYVFRVEDRTMLYTAKTGGDKIFMLSWSLASDQYCTVGPNHIYFWDLKGTKKKGSFGNPNKMTNFACVTFDEKGVAYTAGQNGSIYKWNNGALLSNQPLHKGVVHCIRYL